MATRGWCINQIPIDDPEMTSPDVIAVLYRGGLQDRAIVAVGQESGRVFQVLPDIRGIGIVAERAGFAARMTYIPTFGLAALQVCAGVLLVKRSRDIIVFFGAAWRH